MCPSFAYLLIYEQDQCEGHRTPQTSVHHHELVDNLELVKAIMVGDGNQKDDT